MWKRTIVQDQIGPPFCNFYSKFPNVKQFLPKMWNRTEVWLTDIIYRENRAFFSSRQNNLCRKKEIYLRRLINSKLHFIYLRFFKSQDAWMLSSIVKDVWRQYFLYKMLKEGCFEKHSIGHPPSDLCRITMYCFWLSPADLVWAYFKTFLPL